MSFSWSLTSRSRFNYTVLYCPYLCRQYTPRSMVSSGDPLSYLRHLVMGLRVTGSFPYWWGRSSLMGQIDLPKFSVVLCLWSIFSRSVIVCRTFENSMLIQKKYNNHNVGEMFNLLSSFVTLFIYQCGTIVSACVSPFLTRLLFRLDSLHSDQVTVMTTSAPHMKKLNFIDHQTLFYTCAYTLAFMCGVYETCSSKYWSVTAKVTDVCTCVIVMADSFIFLLTYKEILNVLGKYIKKNTSWVVDEMLSSANKPMQDYTPTGMKRLFHLERQFVQASTHSIMIVDNSKL